MSNVIETSLLKRSTRRNILKNLITRYGCYGRFSLES
jgi:hypothetical protein